MRPPWRRVPATGTTVVDSGATDAGVTETCDADAPRRGRPRSKEFDESILAATLELAGEVGIKGMSMDELAQRAGVSKATIYRRWPSKEILVLQALQSAMRPLDDVDTGEVVEDLRQCLGQMIARMSKKDRMNDVLPHLIEMATHDATLRSAVDDYVENRRVPLRQVLERAMVPANCPPTSTSRCCWTPCSARSSIDGSSAAASSTPTSSNASSGSYCPFGDLVGGEEQLHGQLVERDVERCAERGQRGEERQRQVVADARGRTARGSAVRRRRAIRGGATARPRSGRRAPPARSPRARRRRSARSCGGVAAAGTRPTRRSSRSVRRDPSGAGTAGTRSRGASTTSAAKPAVSAAAASFASTTFHWRSMTTPGYGSWASSIRCRPATIGRIGGRVEPACGVAGGEPGGEQHRVPFARVGPRDARRRRARVRGSAATCPVSTKLRWRVDTPTSSDRSSWLRPRRVRQSRISGPIVRPIAGVAMRRTVTLVAAGDMTCQVMSS